MCIFHFWWMKIVSAGLAKPAHILSLFRGLGVIQRGKICSQQREYLIFIYAFYYFLNQNFMHLLPITKAVQIRLSKEYFIDCILSSLYHSHNSHMRCKHLKADFIIRQRMIPNRTIIFRKQMPYIQNLRRLICLHQWDKI